MRQGCVLSPDLFNLYSEVTLKDLTELNGMKIGERNIITIKFADDSVLIADSEAKVKSLNQVLVQSSGAKGLESNIPKTKVMFVSKENEILRTSISVSEKFWSRAKNSSFWAA